jgi:hypothetical protein
MSCLALSAALTINRTLVPLLIYRSKHDFLTSEIPGTIEIDSLTKPPTPQRPFGFALRLSHVDDSRI